MAHVWQPEHPVSMELAQALVGEQFPDVAAAGCRLVGSGWDCVVYRFGDVAFRFPQRKVGVELLTIELAVLPRLADRVPLDVPRPTYLGQPGPAFPFVFYGHPLVQGRPADEADLDDAARVKLAPALGAFLKDLHAIDPAEVGAPEDAYKRDMRRKGEAAKARLPLLAAAGIDTAFLADVLDAPPASVAPAAPALLHGDMYLRHLIVDGAGGLSGIIDWGDVRGGDVAIDLAVAYTFLPPAARPAFWAAYGEVDEETRCRARFSGLANHAVSLLGYALDVGNERLAMESRRSLDYALAADT